MPSDKKQIANGVFWNLIQKYSGMVVSTLVSMVLARLLSPDEFGIIAIATVLISFLTMLCDMGIGPAIIQRRDLDDNDINSLFTFSCIVGVSLAILFFFCSWFISSIYKLPQLVLICQILTINVFFSAANMVPNALMVKDLQFKLIAKRTLLLQFLSGVISIFVAYKGGGVYALLISPILTSIGIFIFNKNYYDLKFIYRFSITPIKKIFSYSLYQFLFQFICYFSSQIDKLIIGRTISATDLGYYQKSYQLVQLPLSNVGSVVNPVLQPILSKYQNDKKELAKRYNKIIHLLASICFPLGILMFFCGPEIIHIFYGSKWDNAIPCFKIISIAAPIQVVLSSSGSFFQASNETRNLFYLGSINAVITIFLMLIATLYFRHIEAVAIAWSLSTLSGFLCTYYFMYVKVLKQKFSLVLKEFVSPLFLSLIVAVLLYIENTLLEEYPIVNFLAKCMTTFLIAVTSIHITGQLDIRYYLKKIRSIRNPN